MRIGALIPVRLSSERLPGKALMKLGNGCVIDQILLRAEACDHIKDKADIVVCTTGAAADDPLVNHVTAAGYSVFRGHTDDIIRRFGDAMAHFSFDAVVQIDGDDPFSATEYMNATMDAVIADQHLDIAIVNGLPLGVAVKSFTRAAMEKVLAQYQTARNDTGFIYFFTKSGICTVRELDPISDDHVHETVRLTLDYPDDLKMMNALIDACPDQQPVSLSELVQVVYDNPGLVDVNRYVEEEYWQRTADKVHLEYRDASGEVQTIKA